jgi:hypothetical protein
LWDEKGSWAYSVKDYPGIDEWLTENLMKNPGRKIVVCMVSVIVTILVKQGIIY